MKTKTSTFDRLFKNWITSLLGVVIMALAGYYLFLNIKTLTLENIAVASVLGAVGFVFLFVKDKLITGIFNKFQSK